MAIVVGHTTFRATYADSQPLFRVIEKVGRGAYKCAVDASEPDWTGVVKLFSAAEIDSAQRMARLFDDLGHHQAGFWGSRKVGEVLHYCDGFDKFVRGVVVEIDGVKKLKPTALVGNWSAHDLPKRRENGDIDYGYNARKIVEPSDDGCWQPSCVYEDPTSSYSKGTDPRGLPEIDLTLPEMTPDEKLHASKVKQLEEISSLISKRWETRLSPDVVLSEIRRIAAE